jgi:sugar/nucleoside kinase (ribokinase family)
MKRVFIIGGTTFDYIVYLNKLPEGIPQTIHYAPMQETCGSTGTGKAVALKKLGVPNTLYSVFGNDSYGESIKTFLAKEGVDLLHTIDTIGTERHINLMDKEGGRISMFVTQSSEQVLHPYQLVEQYCKNADVIVLNIIAYCKQLVEMVKKSTKPVWTDLHDYDGTSTYHTAFIDTASYIHLSSDNLSNYQEVMQRLIASGKKLVICTHGKKGASLLTEKGEWIELPALEMKVVDSNGAGDSFFAGFLFGWLQQLPLQQCMQYGTICGAYAVTDYAITFKGLSQQFLEQQWLGLFGKS